METKVFGEKITNQKYRERKAVYGLALNDLNQIGIIKTPRGYFLPGGGIENGESHIQCLEREFGEETGYHIKVKDFIGRAILYDYAPTIKEYLKMVGHFYLVSLTGERQKKVEDDHELIWLDMLEAEKNMMLEHQSWAIRSVIKKGEIYEI